VAQGARLVEMLVAIHEPRRNQLVAKIDNLSPGWRRKVRAEPFDPPVSADGNVDPLRARGAAPQGAAAAQQERLRSHHRDPFRAFFFAGSLANFLTDLLTDLLAVFLTDFFADFLTAAFTAFFFAAGL